VAAGDDNATATGTAVQPAKAAAKAMPVAAPVEGRSQRPGQREAEAALESAHLDHAVAQHANGSDVTRFEFHSELVAVDKERPHAVRVYRTQKHDSTTRGLPDCGIVDGWYLSLNGLPFWPVASIPTGMHRLAAACDYEFVEWPDGKNIRDEVPSDMGDMRVVFSKVKPPDELYWKSEL